jgi:hypothetical protein
VSSDKLRACCQFLHRKKCQKPLCREVCCLFFNTEPQLSSQFCFVTNCMACWVRSFNACSDLSSVAVSSLVKCIILVNINSVAFRSHV